MSPADRKTEILALAEELLQTRGYSGFSYADLARELAVSKAAIHHHFATKEDLGLALVEHYQQELLDAHRQIDAHAADAGQALELLVEAAAEKLVQGCKVCPSGIFEAEQGAVPESLAAAARRLDESMHEWLAGLLTRGRARGELAFVGEPEDQAWMVMATFQGAFQKARSLGEPAYRTITRQLLAAMGVASASPR